MSGITGHHGKSGIVGGDGVTTSSTWYTTASQTLSSSTETVENFAISNAPNYQNFGTIPTEASGVFTMSSTGYWFVSCQIHFYQSSPTNDGVGVEIEVYDGAWNSVAQGMMRFSTTDGTSAYKYIPCESICRVQSIASNQIRIQATGVNTGATILTGATMDDNPTGDGSLVTFTKLSNL